MRNMQKSQQISKMSYAEFKKLTPKEQKRVTSVLVSAMNKRIKRLGNTEIGRLSPTYQAFERRGNKYYSVKGLTGDALYNRFEALSESLNKSTSVREWKKLRNETLEKLNLDDLSPDDEKAFWSMYRKFQEDNTRYKDFLKKKEVSDKVLTYIAHNFEEQGYDYSKKTRNKIMKYVREEYEKDKMQKHDANRERGASIYVSNDEGEELF